MYFSKKCDGCNKSTDLSLMQRTTSQFLCENCFGIWLDTKFYEREA